MSDPALPLENADTDKDLFESFYLESPPTDVIIDTDGIKLVRIRSGQKMVYWRLGIVAHEPKEAGLRLIVGLGELWGSGMVVNTDEVRNQHIEVATVQTRDDIELKTATATLLYNIANPVLTARAAFDDKTKQLAYQPTLGFIAQTALRQFIRNKTLADLAEVQQDIFDSVPDTRNYILDKLGIQAHKLLYRRIDLPDTLERELAEKAIAIREAEGRLEIAKRETAIAAELEQAAKHLTTPEAMELRRLQSLDNLVETQKNNPNLFIGIDPLLGLTARAYGGRTPPAAPPSP